MMTKNSNALRRLGRNIQQPLSLHFRGGVLRGIYTPSNNNSINKNTPFNRNFNRNRERTNMILVSTLSTLSNSFVSIKDNLKHKYNYKYACNQNASIFLLLRYRGYFRFESPATIYTSRKSMQVMQEDNINISSNDNNSNSNGENEKENTTNTDMETSELVDEVMYHKVAEETLEDIQEVLEVLDEHLDEVEVTYAQGK